MKLMSRMSKPLWESGKKVIMGSFFFVLKGLLVCLREGSMEIIRPRRIYIGYLKFIDMEAMPIVK